MPYFRSKTRNWPPSPQVEDEEVALTRELTQDGVSKGATVEETPFRGTLNQYPIIQDTDTEGSSNENIATPTSSVVTDSSVSSKPTVGRKHSQFTSKVRGPTPEPPKASHKVSASDSEAGQRSARGRSPRPRIETNLDNGLHGMRSGQRRAPSPYAFTKPESKMNPNPHAGSTLLSPDRPVVHPGASLSGESRRPSSARPRSRPRYSLDSEDSDSEEHKKRYSRRDLKRVSFSTAGSKSGHVSREPDRGAKQGSIYTQAKKNSRDGHVAAYQHGEPQSKRYSRESPYVSSSEERWSKNRSDFIASKKTNPRESPYTSSAEEERAKRQAQDRASRPDRNDRKERPRLDLSARHFSYHGGPSEERPDNTSSSQYRSTYGPRGYLDPSDLRSPTAADYINRALGDGPRSTRETPRTFPHSPQRSPLPSPRHSPPQTPAGNWSSKDYYFAGVPAASDRLPRSSRDSDLPRVTREPDRVNSRPSSRAGSTAGTSSPSNHLFERAHYRSGSYGGPLSAEPARIDTRYFQSGSEASRHSRQPSSATSQTFASSQFSSPLSSARAQPASASAGVKGGRRASLSMLPPCPRSFGETGYSDWFTMRGAPDLDICPSCMKTIGASRFRDSFVPQTAIDHRKPVYCDFSKPWLRYAWSQLMEQGSPNLAMIYQVLDNFKTSTSCPGKKLNMRIWYRLPDPKGDGNLPDLYACSECVRTVRIILPEIGYLFKRTNRQEQERSCDLTPHSRRFDGYMNKLEEANLQFHDEHLRKPNLDRFVEHFKKTTSLRECQGGDQLIGQPWHFDPRLPEFTICEECYEHVVWPLRDKTAAKGICRTLQMVPRTRADTGISCQLYSDRMRKAFTEVVKYDDFKNLREMALARYDIEQELQKDHHRLMSEMAAGYDRRADLQAVAKMWKKWE